MADAYGSPQQIRSDLEAKKGGATEASLWLRKIAAARKGETKWRKAAHEAIEIYEGETQSQISNLFHSNIETIVPSLYNSTPIPDVRRRYNDEDKVGKEVCDLVERAVSYEIDQHAFDKVMVAHVKASCLAGRGVVRVRYEPTIEGDQITGQKTYTEVVPWDRFVRGPSRSWSRMPWCAYKHDLTAEELMKLGVGKDKLETLGFGSSDDEDEEDDDADEENVTSGPQKGVYLTIPVYEVWDKAKRRVLFVTPDDRDFLIAELPDPLQLPDFFDCPEPLQQITRDGSPTPVCPYEIYKELMEEFNRISNRIKGLIQECKARGVADIKLKADLERAKDLGDSEFAYAEGAQEFLQGGGATLEQAIAWWPIDKIVAVLQQLYVQRDQLKQLIYEVTGLSDILRGASDARETATAQQIKTQWGSLRLQRLQAEVARVARDLFRMMAHIICRHYEWETIKQMTGLTFAPQMPDMPQPPEGTPPEMQQQMAAQAQMQAQQEAMQFEQAVMQLFRSDQMRSFRIDIESDSTIRGDQQRNAEQMNLFLQVTAQFATAVGGLVQIAPQVLPAATEIFVSFARKFKLGKQAEDALESLTEVAKQAAENPQPDPQQAKAQADMQAMQMKVQADGAKAQADIHLKQMDMKLKEMEIQLKAIELQMKQVEGANMGAELDIKRQGMDLEHAHKVRMADLEHAAIARKADTEIGITKKRGEVELDGAINQAAVKREMANTELSAKKTGSAIDMKAKAKKAGIKGKVAADDELEPDPTLMALGQMIQTGQQATLAGLAEIGKKLDAPRVVNVKRDKSGRIAGAESTVAG